MSDFELAYLLNEILNSSADRLIEFMTGLFAMLFASFVVGRKLSKGIVVGAYVGAILFLLQMRKGLSVIDTTTAQDRA